MLLKRKRTLAKEKRMFNSKWELDYIMMETATDSMMCLICRHVLKTVKGDNAKQHCRRHMSHKYAKLKGKSRKICVEILKTRVRQQTSCISTFVKSNNAVIAARLSTEWHIILVRRESIIPIRN